MNSLVREIDALRTVVVWYAAILFSVCAAFLVLTPEILGYSGLSASSSLATNLFLEMKDMLIPETVSVVTLGPVAPFVAPIVVAFLVAIFATFPIGLFLLARFLSPALLPAERRSLLFFVLPALALFYAGGAFAYFLIIPETFSVLYSFAAPADVIPMFALDQFLSSVFLLTFVTGSAFLLPVIMAALGRIGLIPPAFWLRHWRGATFSVVLFSAIVTPDGSGVTMAFLSVPLLGLYAIGTVSAAVSAPKRVI